MSCQLAHLFSLHLCRARQRHSHELSKGSLGFPLGWRVANAFLIPFKYPGCKEKASCDCGDACPGGTNLLVLTKGAWVCDLSQDALCSEACIAFPMETRVRESSLPKSKRFVISVTTRQKVKVTPDIYTGHYLDTLPRSYQHGCMAPAIMFNLGVSSSPFLTSACPSRQGRASLPPALNPLPDSPPDQHPRHGHS